MGANANANGIHINKYRELQTEHEVLNHGQFNAMTGEVRGTSGHFKSSSSTAPVPVLGSPGIRIGNSQRTSVPAYAAGFEQRSSSGDASPTGSVRSMGSSVYSGYSQASSMTSQSTTASVKRMRSTILEKKMGSPSVGNSTQLDSDRYTTVGGRKMMKVFDMSSPAPSTCGYNSGIDFEGVPLSPRISELDPIDEEPIEEFDNSHGKRAYDSSSDYESDNEELADSVEAHEFLKMFGEFALTNAIFAKCAMAMKAGAAAGIAGSAFPLVAMAVAPPPPNVNAMQLVKSGNDKEDDKDLSIEERTKRAEEAAAKARMRVVKTENGQEVDISMMGANPYAIQAMSEEEKQKMMSQQQQGVTMQTRTGPVALYQPQREEEHFLELIFPGWEYDTFIWKVTCFQIAMLGVTMALGHIKATPTPCALYVLGASWGPALARGELWRLVCPMALHANFMHLFFNVFFQLRIGFGMEKQFGSSKMKILYLTCGVIGNLISVMLDPYKLAVGASTAGFGLIGVWVAEIMMSWELLGANKDRTLIWILFMLVSVTTMSGMTPSMDLYGHFGGAFGGFLMGIIMADMKEEHRPLW